MTAYKDKTIIIWDTISKSILNKFVAHSDSVSSVSISADDAYIASAGLDNTIKLWSEDGRQMRKFVIHNDPKQPPPADEPTDTALCVTFGINAKTIVSGYENGSVKLWNVATGRFREIGDVAEPMTFWGSFR